MPEYVVDRVIFLLKQNKNKLSRTRVLIIGVTYKKDVKDLRKSPALDIIEALQKRNIRICYHDPLITFLKFNQIDLKSVALNRQNLKNFDCVVIISDHSSLNYKLILESSKPS